MEQINNNNNNNNNNDYQYKNLVNEFDVLNHFFAATITTVLNDSNNNNNNNNNIMNILADLLNTLINWKPSDPHGCCCY